MKQKLNLILFIIIVIAFYNSVYAQWVEHPLNPLITSDIALDGIMNDPSVIKDNGQYIMYYGAINGDFSESETVRIFRATSVDGINWIRNSVPILTPGGISSWDSIKVEAPSVIKSKSNNYLMYYSGNSDAAETGFQIGLATSTDGISWTKYSSNPVLTLGNIGDFDELSVFEQSVVYDTIQSKYYLWYAGLSTLLEVKIGLAESIDGINWIKLGMVMQLDNERENINDAGLTNPNVIHCNGQFEMFYCLLLNEGQIVAPIWHSVSNDGLIWTKDIVPILQRGDSATSWTGQGIHSPTVLVDSGNYLMWYGGTHTDYFNFFESGIGLASKPISTGFGEFNEENDYTIYPNPTNQHLTLEFNNSKHENCTLILYNSQGRLVRKITNIRTDRVKVERKNLTSGLYFFQLCANGEVRSISKLIVE